MGRPAHRSTSACSRTRDAAAPGSHSVVLRRCRRARALTAQSTPQIPLVTGLTIVSALHYPEGDRENVVTVSDASSAGASYVWRFEHTRFHRRLEPPGQRPNLRDSAASDLAGAPRIDQIFMSKGPEESPGSTAFSFSRAVYQRLLTDKRTPFRPSRASKAPASAHRSACLAASSIRTSQCAAHSRCASSKPEPMAMLVNGQRVNLPTLHYTGNFTLPGREGDDRFLGRRGQHASAHSEGALGEGPAADDSHRPSTANDVGRRAALTTECRAELPGIYFAFNSSSLDPAFDPALADSQPAAREGTPTGRSPSRDTRTTSEAMRPIRRSRRSAPRRCVARSLSLSHCGGTTSLGRLRRDAAARAEHHHRRSRAQPASRARAPMRKVNERTPTLGDDHDSYAAPHRHHVRDRALACRRRLQSRRQGERRRKAAASQSASVPKVQTNRAPCDWISRADAEKVLGEPLIGDPVRVRTADNTVPQADGDASYGVKSTPGSRSASSRSSSRPMMPGNADGFRAFPTFRRSSRTRNRRETRS